MNLSKYILTFLSMSIMLVGHSQQEDLFDRATDYYNNGEYTKALGQYEQILESGRHSAALYFNMGNCHYKLNAIGPSIYYYEKALLLNPNDTEIINNLSYAQNMRLDAIEDIPKPDLARFYDQMVNMFSFDQWAYIAIFLVILFVLGYLCYFFLRMANQKRFAFVSSMFFLIAGIISVLMAYLQYQEFKNDNPAIIYTQQVRISSEPNNQSEAVFTLHEGTKVNVLDQLEDWSKIRIADGQTGWLKSNNFKLLKDF